MVKLPLWLIIFMGLALCAIIGKFVSLILQAVAEDEAKKTEKRKE